MDELDAPYGDGGFLLSIPTYTVVDRAGYRNGRMANSLLRAYSEIGGPFVPLFTDSDLAERFIEAKNLTGKIALTIKTAESLCRLLEMAKKEGFTHVGIDVETRPPVRGIQPPIGDFLRILRKAEQSS